MENQLGILMGYTILVKPSPTRIYNMYIYIQYMNIYMYIHNIGWCNLFNGPPFDGWLPGWYMALGLPVYLASRLRPATD